MNRLPTIDGLPCPEGRTRPSLARHHILATDSVKSILEFSHTLLKDFYPTRLSSATALRLHVRAHPGVQNISEVRFRKPSRPAVI